MSVVDVDDEVLAIGVRLRMIRRRRGLGLTGDCWARRHQRRTYRCWNGESRGFNRCGLDIASGVATISVT
ncbi:MAG: hypothetical protein ACRDTG_20490 [Pseudonocardiaceae bacterium]